MRRINCCQNFLSQLQIRKTRDVTRTTAAAATAAATRSTATAATATTDSEATDHDREHVYAGVSDHRETVATAAAALEDQLSRGRVRSRFGSRK